MAYKRNVDRLPIIPADATEHNVVCHYCIVGCGYKAYSWDVNRQGGTAPGENKFGVDLASQQEPETAAWYAPSMHNIVRQDGRDVYLVIKPDKGCVVNQGLGSIRGARMAEMSHSTVRGTQQQVESPPRNELIPVRGGPEQQPAPNPAEQQSTTTTTRSTSTTQPTTQPAAPPTPQPPAPANPAPNTAPTP